MNTPHSSKNSGFALVLALSLMAFVLLLLLSITTLVQVETKNAKGSTAQSEARQNALLAMNIAIGQLQKDTGPDQRTTALAALNDGNGVPITQPKWVGVYGNSSAANYSDKPDDITPSAPALLNWLVSGNEGTEYDATTTGTAFGQITAEPIDITYKPDAVTSDLADATANSQLTIDGDDAKLLVGPNSTNADDAAEAIANYVAAPLVDIKTGNVTLGRYAWWVGDEGVKAKVNLRPSYLEQEPGDMANYQTFAYLTAQRSALELVDYDNAGNSLGTDYDFTDETTAENFAKITDLDALSFLGNNFTSVATERFHDLTSYGHGVLADAYAGGLKKDLTSDFNGASGRPIDSEPIFTPLDTGDTLPTWGQARSLINTNISIASGTPTSDPVLPSDSNVGIYPVVTAASLGFDFYVTGPVIDPADPNIAYYEFQVAIVPLIALWNPHTVTISPDTYELGFRIHEKTSGAANVWVDFDGAEADVLNLHTGKWASTASTENFLRFQLDSKEAFRPGEVHLYSLADNGSPYQPGTTIMTLSDEDVDNYINHTTTTTENLRIPAEVTFSPRQGTYIYELPDVDVKVLSERTAQSLDLVLAEEGRISDLSNQTGWYHAVLDAQLGQRGRKTSEPRSISGQAYVWLQKGSSGEYDHIRDLPQSAIKVLGTNMSAYKIVNVMERRGGTIDVGNKHGGMSWSNQNNAGRTRWLITGNPRAKIVRDTKTEIDKKIRGSSVFNSNHDAVGEVHRGDTFLFYYTNSTNGSRLSAGRGMGSSGTQGYGVAALFDHLGTTEQFLSLGQLQHSMIGPFGFYSSYPFGNSWADVRIDRDQHYIANHFASAYGSTNDQTLYDLSWHMNRAVWDRYFVSTVTNTWSASDIDDLRPLPNSRMSYYESPDIDTIKGDDAYDEAAANLWVDGAFNINSTSEQAWRTLLSATFGIPNDNGSFADTGDNVTEIAPIPRFARNQSQLGHGDVSFAASMKGQSGNRQTNYNYVGNRGLSMTFNGVSNGTVEELVNELARTIVDEVKLRGPFLSLGDFVNRAIIEENSSSDEDDIGIKGALQAAIDKMGMDENGDDNSGPRINGREWQVNHANGFDSDDVWYMMEDEWNVEHYLGGPDRGVGNQDKMPYSVSATGSTATMTPADLLTVIGPAISARSDTFRIRTYGETLNPITQKTEGRAWCEAIVQRLPEYVNTDADAPEVEPVALASTENAQFGRKYKILSLRWLDASDI